MKLPRFIFVFILCLILIPSLASASVFGPWKSSPWTAKSSYMEKTTHKLGFGLLNGLTGWSAFFFEPGRESNFFAGLAKGTLYSIIDTAGGALHIVTFPIPLDIPLPEGGVRFD